MKKRTNKLYVLLSLSLLSLILLVGCSVSDSSQDVADDTATRQEDTGSHTSLEQGIELNSDGTGCYSQEISVGENVALASVNFQYDIEKNTITSVDKVQVKAVKGWQYVKLDAVIDAEHIYYDTGRARVSVPFTYFASIGSGTEEYTNSITIDLNTTDT